jgi:hypothetical protein
VSESNPPVALRQATSEANLVFPLKPAGIQKQKQEQRTRPITNTKTDRKTETKTRAKN